MTRRGVHVRRVLVGVMLVVAVVLTALALRSPAAGQSTEAPPRLATPLWSVRRVPQPVLDSVGAQRLQAELASVAAGTEHCFEVTDGDRTIATQDAAAPEIPASTLKLLTAAGALYVLGPDFRYATRAVAAAEPRDGAVEHLYLLGAGDPLLATPERIAALAADSLTAGTASTPLAELADGITSAGVRSIPGGVVGVDARYDAERFLPQWPATYRTEVGSIGALVVNGGLTGPAGTGGPAADPAVEAAAQLTRLLVARGVSVGPPSRGAAPAAEEPVATVHSPPLSDEMSAFLASSNNLAGEMLVKELAVRAGKPGTTADGVQVLAERLAVLGIPMQGVTIVDGSGLSRENRATCSALLATLALGREPRFATLRDGLAVAGERGTLATRLRGSALAGKLDAKTGSLSGVSGLAGETSVRRPLDFALLLNGSFGESAGIALRERMATAIGTYPSAPSAEDLVPAP